jgi:hypothetical protein
VSTRGASGSDHELVPQVARLDGLTTAVRSLSSGTVALIVGLLGCRFVGLSVWVLRARKRCTHSLQFAGVRVGLKLASRSHAPVMESGRTASINVGEYQSLASVVSLIVVWVWRQRLTRRTSEPPATRKRSWCATRSLRSPPPTETAPFVTDAPPRGCVGSHAGPRARGAG